MAETKKTLQTKEIIEKPLKVKATLSNEKKEEGGPARSTAKAGKRSPKAIKEVEEKTQKETRKALKAEDKEEVKKTTKKPPRSRLERAGKKYREAAKLIDRTKQYPLSEALELAIKTNPATFDASVELHINLGVDPKQADQNIRGTTSLPAGTGKNIRVAVIAQADDIDKAKKAGAESASVEELFAKLDKEQTDFDVLIATPELMPKLSKYARLLGPKGLMPSPKSGTVAKDVAKAVKEAKTGLVEYRIDSTSIIHLGIGKVSFGGEKLLQNAQAILSSVRAAKPASLKGLYIKSIYISTTMGPGIEIELNPS